MQPKTTTIACPNCNTPIALEIVQLIIGTKFSCMNCEATIGLANESKDMVKQAVNSLETTLKNTKK